MWYGISVKLRQLYIESLATNNLIINYPIAASLNGINPCSAYLCSMNRNSLYYIAAIIWGIPGVIITVKGVRTYMTMPLQKSWWLPLVTVFVLVSFFFMFRKVVDRYSARIESQPQKTGLQQTFPLRGWILIACMVCLGIALRSIPGIPSEFIASFYSGLGPMLIFAACRFIFNRFSLKKG